MEIECAAEGDRPWGASGGIALDRAAGPDGRKRTLEGEEEGEWTL